MVDYLDPEIWMTMKQAAEKWGCHYETVRRNFPLIPATERLVHKRGHYIWVHTPFRPQKRAGHPPVTYYKMLERKSVKEKLPNAPDRIDALPPQKREFFLAKVEAAMEPPPKSSNPVWNLPVPAVSRGYRLPHWWSDDIVTTLPTSPAQECE